MAQFIGESLLLVAMSALIAVMLVIVILPSFSNLIGKEISLSPAGGLSGFISVAGLILFTGILAGFYPAFVLASYNPAEVLKGTLNPGSMSKTLRGILVVFQFSVSIIIIIGAFAVYRQLNFMTSADLGFDKENLLVIRRPDALEGKLESFKEQVLRIPGVENVANATAIPGTVFSNNAFLRDDDPEKTIFLINQTLVSFGFAETLGARLVSGRSFSKEFCTDSTAIMINEAAVKALGLKEPVVGQFILQPRGPGNFQRMKVIGVMKDFNIESLHKKITPVCFTIMYGNFEGYLCVRLSGGDKENTIREIEKIWSSISVRQPFQYNFFSDQFNELYVAELKAGRIFILFAVLAVMIACLGLIGLITYMTTVRTREVGIRKTYGASERSVVSLLSREVLVLILVSSLLAYPLAWYGISIWLRGFAEKTTVNPLIFIAATLIAVITGWLSISWQAIRAAGYNPATALRYK
jgi:putative ABC transport system permease protein